MGCAPAVFGRFLNPGGLGGRPRFAFALPTMPLVREKARSSSSNFCDDESWGFWLIRLRLSSRCRASKVTLSMRMNYAVTIYQNRGATLDDLHEAVTTLEETEQIARRVFGGAHPLTVDIGKCLQIAREASTGSA